MAWLPVLKKAETTIFDYATVSGNPGRWRRTPCGSSVAEIKEEIIAALGIPEKSLRRVIRVGARLTLTDRPGSFRVRSVHVLQSSVSAAKMAETLKAKGLIEGSLQGKKAWKRSQDGPFVLCAADGYILCPRPADAAAQKILERILMVRAGKEPSLRSDKGMTDLIAAVPKGLPVKISCGTAGSTLTPAPKATIWWGDAKSHGEVQASLFGSEKDANAMLRQLGPKLKSMKASAKVIGKIVRINIPDPRDPKTLIETAKNDLRVLVMALEEFQKGHPAYPTTKEGLAAVKEYLRGDLGKRLLDPWGNPYIYRFPHPKQKHKYVLRSAGPDGKKDTTDDIFPGGE